MPRVRVFSFLLYHAAISIAIAQPQTTHGGIEFGYRGKAGHSVALVGDFNGWSKQESPCVRDSVGVWKVTLTLTPGSYQYKFVVDDSLYVLDPGNTAVVDNYNSTARNSVFVVTNDQQVMLTSTPPARRTNVRDEYPATPDRGPVYLNIIWHQHQPLYLNPETDQLTGPWVRTHATKDYYDMAAMLRKYPDVHCTINLTSSLLVQLREYYVERLRPFINVKRSTINVKSFLKAWKGKTDPWIDLNLTPASAFTAADKKYIFRNTWNCFSISENMLARFPAYRALRDRLTAAPRDADDVFTTKELREITCWFALAMFDPDFLAGPVTLEDGSVCDVSRFVKRDDEGHYMLRKQLTDADSRRMVVEMYKVMANVIPVHRALRYDPAAHKGQIDVITTPYYHPILPLIFDSDLARTCQPNDSMPPQFAYPEDAHAQVSKAVKFYTDVFGAPPSGMWPGEGSVAQPVLGILRKNGVLWTASDVKVLVRSRPASMPNTTPYQFPTEAGPVALVFRDTELSDRIGFRYQEFAGEEAAEDFVQALLERAPGNGEPDVLVTVILDGENAWEWYKHDEDGKGFLNALYRKLGVLFKDQRIITTTMSEYLNGNPARSIAAHPVEHLPAMEWLWPGSWINANYDTWIGEEEENKAWEYLLHARRDLGSSGIPAPDPRQPLPPEHTRAGDGARAWEAMYAAEGSDWFWWYGADQGAPGGDRPFDEAFRLYLRNVYRFAGQAGAHMQMPDFPPILSPEPGAGTGDTHAGTGTMAHGGQDVRVVTFRCDARGQQVSTGVYIAGDLPALGAWRPNTVMLRDDGTDGDDSAHDGIWCGMFSIPVGSVIHYKYTNSGRAGEWVPGEEFAVRNRTVTVDAGSETLVINDIFGK